MTSPYTTPQTPPTAPPPRTPTAPSKQPSQITALAAPQYVHLACDLSNSDVTKPSRCNANRKPGDGSPPRRLHRPGHSCPCAPQPQNKGGLEIQDEDEDAQMTDGSPCPQPRGVFSVPNLPSFNGSPLPPSSPRMDPVPSDLQLLQEQPDSQLNQTETQTQNQSPTTTPPTTTYTHLIAIARTIATQLTTPNQTLNGIISIHDFLALSGSTPENSDDMRRDAQRLLAVLREIHEVSGLGIGECEEMIAGEGRGVGDGGGDVEMTD